MNKRINRIVLWFCTGVLSLMLVGVILSCEADAGGSPVTYPDVSDDCGVIEASKQHIPKDTAELKRLIERDITQQGNTVNLNYIDTSAITDMSSLFETEEGATFNGAIHCWDVSKVTTMSAMFKDATAFNQDISSWDVGAVTTMESMFEGAEVFEADLTAWSEHVLQTVNTASMFAGANKIKKVPNWKEAGICFAPSTHASVMENKAKLVEKINALITVGTPSPNLNHLETCNVKNMSELFKSKATFNGDISQWDVSKVTTMANMFEGARAFNQDISSWIVNNVDDMSHMFYRAYAFNKDISGWSVSNVDDMRLMFAYAKVFNQPIGVWDVGKVTNMRHMFEGAEAFNQPIGDWDVSKVTDMSYMFFGAKQFCQNLEDWGEHGLDEADKVSIFLQTGSAQGSCSHTNPSWYTP